MSPLPSFPELMQSLGLPKDAKAISNSNVEGGQYSDTASSRSPSPSSLSSSPKLKERPMRVPSPTIVVSHFDSEADEPVGFKRHASAGNIKTARYSPYSNRRGSISAIDHQRDPEQTAKHGHRKTPSSSSCRSSSGSLSASDDSIPPVPPLPARRARGGSLERLKVVRYTPISSFARRRSPQVSPTSPSFSNPGRERERSRSADLPSPVMLPSLPPMLAASFVFPDPAPSSSRKSKMKADSLREKERRSMSRSPRTHAMDVDIDGKENVFVKHHQAGLRISSFHRQVAPIA